MAKLGFRLQAVGFTIAAAAYFLIWLFRPHSGPMPGLAVGDYWKPSHLVLAFAAALIVTGLASLRWRWAGIFLVLVAIPAAWYAITNHAMQWSHLAYLPIITYAPVVIFGVLLSILGLAIRALAGQTHSKAGA
jgi:thiol:disulfide interchange protein